MLGLLRKVDRSFRLRGPGDFRAGNADGFWVDLIRPRDAVWRVQRADRTSTDDQAWRCVGLSEIVRDQEAVFLEAYEPTVLALDSCKTKLSRDIFSLGRAAPSLRLAARG